jgi:N-acetylneuraminic acid mutarotase
MKLTSFLIVSYSLWSFISLGQPWFQKASFGGVGRHRSVGIAIGNKGYIGTGHVNGTGIDISYKDWWQYDPASDSWTQKADFPVSGHGVTAWGTETHGYVGGGSALTNQFYCYNPVANEWTTIANCPLSPGDVQGFSVQNKGYVLSGNSIAEYDPTTNAWSLKANCPITVSTWSSAFGTSGSGFVKTGINLYEFKPSQNVWIQRASFPGSSTNGSSAFAIDGKGYITCGYVGGLSVVTDQVWEFNSGSNSWSLIGEFPGTSRRFPVAFSIEGKGYFGTGTNGINFNDFWQFNYNPLGSNELVLDETNVSVFPNPAIDEVTLTFSNQDYALLSTCSLSIYNLQGELVDKVNQLSPIVTIQRNSKISGMYIYKISCAEKVAFTGKLIYN